MYTYVYIYTHHIPFPRIINTPPETMALVGDFHIIGWPFQASSWGRKGCRQVPDVFQNDGMTGWRDGIYRAEIYGTLW